MRTSWFPYVIVFRKNVLVETGDSWIDFSEAFLFVIDSIAYLEFDIS